MVHNPTDDIDLKVSTLDPDIQIGEVYKVLRSTGQYCNFYSILKLTSS